MSPVDQAIHTLNRAVASFHPGSMPLLSRGHYRRELAAWLFLPVMLGTVEGGVAGVLVKNAFEGTVDARTLNVAVALVAGAPAFANITSMIWAALSHGRHKIRFMVGLQIATAGLVAMVGAAPRTAAGLLVLTLGVVGARVCWSGVVTIRSTVWRANYPRSDRATLAGKLATVQAVMLTAVGLVVGAAMNVDQDAFRVIYPLAAGVGLVGTWFYRRLRVRGHRVLVRTEQRDEHLVNPLGVLRELRGHPTFRRYMLCMFVFGTGNMMVATPLVILLRDRFGLDIFTSILITSTIPAALMPLTIPLWSGLLDRVHIVSFRSVHGWAFVASISLFLAGSLATATWLVVLGALAKGVAMGGGVLGWNLGHHDFAPRHLAGQFMGVHVTLTGLRGFIAPVAAVLLYETLESFRPGTGPWVFAACLALSLAGTLGFAVMARGLEWKAES